ncbi:hypothetical protein Gotur_024988 [Gossypium turneri]
MLKPVAHGCHDVDCMVTLAGRFLCLFASFVSSETVRASWWGDPLCERRRMERQPSPSLERASSFEMDEPLTLTKKQYQAALAAVIKASAKGKGKAPAPPVGEKPAKKIAGKVGGKGCGKFNL